MDKVFAVIGLGAFGRQICRTIMNKGGKVIALDNNPALVESVNEWVTRAILLDSTDQAALASVSLEDVDVAVVAIGDNIEASVLTTAILKEIGLPFVLARAVSEIHEKVLRKVGADEVINLEIEEGVRIASRLIAPEVADRIPVAEDISLAEVFLPADFQKMRVADLQLQKKFHLSLAAIKHTLVDVDELGNPLRKDEVKFPQEDTELSDGDVLLVFGRDDDIDAFIRAGRGE